MAFLHLVNNMSPFATLAFFVVVLNGVSITFENVRRYFCFSSQLRAHSETPNSHDTTRQALLIPSAVTRFSSSTLCPTSASVSIPLTEVLKTAPTRARRCSWLSVVGRQCLVTITGIFLVYCNNSHTITVFAQSCDGSPATPTRYHEAGCLATAFSTPRRNTGRRLTLVP